MPRPKVRPEDRQRSLRACSACKSSKIRCNSELPCSACVKRGRAQSCVYSDIDRRRRNRSTINAANAQAASGSGQQSHNHKSSNRNDSYNSNGSNTGCSHSGASSHNRTNSTTGNAANNNNNNNNNAGSGNNGSHIHFQASPAVTAVSGAESGQSPLARTPSPSVEADDNSSGPLPKDQLMISSTGEKGKSTASASTSPSPPLLPPPSPPPPTEIAPTSPLAPSPSSLLALGCPLVILKDYLASHVVPQSFPRIRLQKLILRLFTVYVGETASLSFLYFLRKTLRPYVGRTRFTDGETHNIMHEWETGHVESNHLEASAEQMYLLLESYFEATSGLFDLFTADEIDALVSERARTSSTSPASLPSEQFSPLTAKSKRDDLAALDVALAIGAQTQPQGSTIIDAQTQAAFFSRARQVAFEGMIANPTLSMVRLFLLMAFYMLGACHRNAASMYLGVASKAAVVLGLSYIRKHRNANLEDYDLRLRVWNSLVVLDILMSFILGRPQSMPPTRSDASRASTPVPDNNQGTFSAIVRGCTLIENIVQTLRTSNMLHVPTAESLLEQLRLWTQSLPEAVRQFTFTSAHSHSGSAFSLESADRQALVGNVHVSCVYYFAVILITRPFLIADHMPRLRERAKQNGVNTGGAPSTAPTPTPDAKVRNAKVAKLAQVCVSSAMFMAETLQKLKKSNFAFGNLCLVKAWIFGSGLVLGFSMFAGEPRQDVTDAFTGARDVLESIAERSPQAKIYYDILTTMGEAVMQYRRRESLEARRGVQHYMSQILVVDVAADQAQQQQQDQNSKRGQQQPPQQQLVGPDGQYFDGSNMYGNQQNMLGGMNFQNNPDASANNFLRATDPNVNHGIIKQFPSPFSAHDLMGSSDPGQDAAPSLGPSGMTPFGSGDLSNAAVAGGGGMEHITDSILDDLQIDWGDLDLQLGDDSGIFESGPFERLFYSVE